MSLKIDETGLMASLNQLNFKIMNKRVFDNEHFARLILDIVANYMSNYKYDAFYDIAKLRKIDEDKNPVTFTLYFRRSGCDTSSIDTNTTLFSCNTPELEHTLFINNKIVIKVEYSTVSNESDGQYTVTVVKNEHDYPILYFSERKG